MSDVASLKKLLKEAEPLINSIAWEMGHTDARLENLLERIRAAIAEPEIPIQQAVDAIDMVLNVHENHIFPPEVEALETARAQLTVMQKTGFK